MFSRSVDGGVSWSPPVRINDDLGNNAFQWFGTMSVAPDGRIDVIWLDTRDGSNYQYSSLYYSYSLDQGWTWSANERLSDLFNSHLGWPQQDKMGDYFDMYSDETGAHLAWAATFNEEQDVYYSHIIPSYVRIKEQEAIQEISLLTSYPNPSREKATIRYELSERSHVSLYVYNMTGEEVASLVSENQDAGLHQVVFDAKGLGSGVYYCRLQTEHSSRQHRLVILK
jgi:hypothetical protein